MHRKAREYIRSQGASSLLPHPTCPATGSCRATCPAGGSSHCYAGPCKKQEFHKYVLSGLMKISDCGFIFIDIKQSPTVYDFLLAYYHSKSFHILRLV